MESPTCEIKSVIEQMKITYQYQIPKRAANFRPEDLDRSFYPSDETLSSLASIAYNSTYEALPDGWRLLSKGENKKDGYYGVAFFREESRQLVISHRGTNDYKDAIGDFIGMVFNKCINQIHSACTFAFQVLSQLEADDISISITGHSLGAWLAQITAFAIKYLTVEGDRFRDLEESERKHHPHTVTFDSPGCYKMLCELSNKYFPKNKEEDLIQALDVTNYFVVPNMVNAYKRHIGKKLCFQFDDSSEFEKNSFLRSIFRATATHTLDFHNANNFVEAFRNRDKIVKVVKWPTHSFKKAFKDSLAHTVYNWKSVVQGDVEAPSVTDEYTLYYKYCNESNDFRPDPDRLKKDNVDLPYKTEKYDEATGNISLFKENEIDFLGIWEKIKRNQIGPGNIIEFLDRNNLGTFPDFLPDFEILKNEIKCESAEKFKQLVNRIKWLFAFFPDARAVMANQISINSSAFEAATE